MKNDDFINENSIDDLIKYSEDEDSNTSDDFDDLNTESIAEAYFEANNYEEEIASAGKKRGNKLGFAAGIVIVTAALIAFFSIDSGIIGNYKNNFSNNFSRMFAAFKPEKKIPEAKAEKKQDEYKTEVKSSVILSEEKAADSEFIPYKEGIICAGMNHMYYIDFSGGVVWETDTAVVDPILAAEGNYILLAEKDRNKICLYSDRRLLYDVDDPDAIMAAKVSANGDVVLVTDKSSYKGGISVYNKTGDQIYSWVSGSDAVISADISSSSRRVAVALLNTETTAQSVIQLFDINKTQSYSQISAEDTVIFDLQFTGNTLSAFGDNRIITISDSGKILSDTTLGDLTHSAMDDGGNKLLSFDDGGVPMLYMYNKKGSLKESMTLKGVAGLIDIDGKNILYNIGRDIYFGRINSKDVTKYTATMDIKKLMIISENTFAVVYSNSIEIVSI